MFETDVLSPCVPVDAGTIFNERLISKKDAYRTILKISDVYERFDPHSFEKDEAMSFDAFFKMFSRNIVDIFLQLPMDRLKAETQMKPGKYSRNEILKSSLPDGTQYQIIVFNFQGAYEWSDQTKRFSAFLFHIYFGYENPNEEIIQSLEVKDTDVQTPVHSHRVPCVSCCYSIEGSDDRFSVYLQENLYRFNQNQKILVDTLDRTSAEHFVSGDPKTCASNFSHHEIILGLKRCEPVS